MKGKIKKVTSAIIVLAMCVSLITAMPMSVSAAMSAADMMLENAYWEVENTAENGYTTNGTYWEMNAPEIADGKMYLTPYDSVMLMLSKVPNIGDFSTSSTYTIEFDAVATETVTDARTLYIAPAGWWNNVEVMGNKVRTGDTWTNVTSLNQGWHYKVEIANTTITSTITDSDGAVVSTGYRTNAEYAKFWNYCLRCENGTMIVDNVKVSKDGAVLLNETFDYVGELPATATTVTNAESYIELPSETVVTEGKWMGSFDFMTDVADDASIAWRNTFMMGANNEGGTKVIGNWVYSEGANIHVKAGDWDGSYQGGLTKGTWYTCKVTIDYEDTTSGTNARWYIYERDTDTLKAEYWWNATTAIDRFLFQDERNSGKCYIDNVEVSVEAPEDLGPYQDQEYTFDESTLPTGWKAGTGDGYSITDGQLVLAGTPNWGADVTFDPNLRESGKYRIGWDYITQGTSFGDYGLFLKLLDSADMSQVKEVFSHMGDGQIHLGNNVFWNITLPTSRMELEVDVDTKAWQLYVDGVAVTNVGGSGVGTWTESLAIGFMNYQHGTCKIDNVTVTKVVDEEPEEPITGVTTVTGAETYIEFPAETVVTEGKWTGSFDFMTDVADDASIAWRNTLMNGVNSEGGTKVTGAWVYSEGANIHVKAGDWDGSYQSALTKGTWYTCKVVIDYDDITSGYNTRWYIIERDTQTQKAEYWTNITTSIDRLLVQDEQNSGKCYVENVTASVEESTTINNVTIAETYINFPEETVVTEGKWTGTFDFMTDVADGSNVAWRNTFMMGANDAGGTKVIGAWVYTEGTSGLHVKAGDWDGSYQCALTKGTWYTCKVVIDYEDTTSGNNARWYIYEKGSDTPKAEYWWNATTSIDRLLVQDEQNSGKCYVDNVTATVSEHEHAYGDWETDGTENHKKTCNCGDVVTETHDWNEGVVEGTVKTYTCTVCGGTKTEDIAPAVAVGDANEDNEVDVKDVITIRRFVTGGYGVTVNEAAANVNGDTDVDVKDVITLRRFITGGYGVEL